LEGGSLDQREPLNPGVADRQPLNQCQSGFGEGVVVGLEDVADVLAVLGLQLNPDKTRIVCLTKGAEGFDFLGFHLHKVEHWKWKNRWYVQRWPSARAMNTIRAKIKAATDRRFVGLQLATVVERLNPILRGWGGYFRYGNSSQQFHRIDSYVHERLAILASNKHARTKGRNWASHYPWAWCTSLGVYRLGGTVRHGTAHARR
jgi:hypothetical protein